VTVQVEDAPEFTVVGLQAKPVTSMGATRLNVVVCDAPFKVAVIVALWVVVRVPAVAAKVAVVDVAATVTEGGTVSKGLLAETVTRLPPAGAD
jgi:hypothetical protein